MAWARTWLTLLSASCLLAACGLSPVKQQQVAERVARDQSQIATCTQADACAAASPFHAWLARADSRHHVLALERGADALRLRLHLVRAARRSIDIQTYIFQNDASSELLLTELLAAARRGVQVRLLVDQLFSLNDPQRLAQLALAHRNFHLRFYNPTFREARTQSWEFAAGILCCFSRFNQRMHNKLFLIDGALAITGGRNYRDAYFDLDPEFAYYDRELLVASPVVAAMTASFEQFWQHRRSLPATQLHDVGRALLRLDADAPTPAEATADQNGVHARLAALSREADDPSLIEQRFLRALRTVRALRFVADAPVKIGSRRPEANAVSLAIAELFAGAQQEVLLQTPYLVLSRDSRRVFRARQAQQPPVHVQVSTNSLAATDAYPVYALSYKYKKRYLRELGFRIHELRPDPADLPTLVELAAPILTPRVSLHGKSAVIDRRYSLIGTHNFDPRSDRFNTEAAVIIDDRGFADSLARSLLRDMAPGNAWVIAPREHGPAPFYRISRWLETLSTALPVFDLWPFRYASSFEPIGNCPPLAREHPDFYRCHRDVGDFPGESSPIKRLLTRLATAFGAPLVPVL